MIKANLISITVVHVHDFFHMQFPSKKSLCEKEGMVLGDVVGCSSKSGKHKGLGPP